MASSNNEDEQQKRSSNKPSSSKDDEYAKLKEEVMKEIQDMSKDFGVDVFMICYDEGGQSSWPEDRQRCLSVINKYQAYNEEQEKQNIPFDDSACLEGLGPEELKKTLASLDAKMAEVNKAIAAHPDNAKKSG